MSYYEKAKKHQEDGDYQDAINDYNKAKAIDSEVYITKSVYENTLKEYD